MIHIVVQGGIFQAGVFVLEKKHQSVYKKIGAWVFFTSEPIKVFEIFSKIDRPRVEDKRERAHFIGLFMYCT